MSELNTIRLLLGTYQQTEVEKKLIEKLGGGTTATDKVQRFAAQWSQLVAWSWLEPSDYEGKKTSDDDAQESLRQEFIRVVKELARVCIAEHYCPNMFEDQQHIVEQSDRLSDYLTGKLSKNGLTLPNLYKDLTHRDDYAFTEEFTKLFLWVVSIDRYHGWLAGYNEDKDKFVMVIAYPPRPALSPSVLSASDLHNWIQNKGDADYTPRNPYIPTCMC
ncbi:hypothetical protein QUA27_08760 [Microcoleus sp. Pol14C6]|uniref:hypothetical protein n=1 Tax=unclassified Microcoleus TaxID=2642155 RepID=UPI002FD5094D